MASKTQTPIAEGSQGVAGASKDASRVYFVSTKALGGEGEEGKPNLYLREGGANRLVATLSSEDQVIGEHVPLGVAGAAPTSGARG